MQTNQPTLLRETYALIEDALRRALGKGTYSLKHKGTCIGLSECRPDDFDIEAVVSKLYQAIERYPKSVAPRGRSKENWKLRHMSWLADNNPSQEVVLERLIIQAVEKAHPGEWFNQCPTASGVFTRKGERCHIDLLHRISDEEFELIELKVQSNNPVFAAFEILRNGLLYLHARRSLIADYADKPLLKARKIRLTVLAPLDFYKYKPRGRALELYDLHWFEKALDRAIAAFGKNDCEMTFAFDAFPERFEWTKDLAKQRGVVADEDFLRWVDERHAAFTE